MVWSDGAGFKYLIVLTVVMYSCYCYVLQRMSAVLGQFCDMYVKPITSGWSGDELTDQNITLLDVSSVPTEMGNKYKYLFIY